jgi:hypothetical protein
MKNSNDIYSILFLVTFCDLIWHDIECKRRVNSQMKSKKLIYDSIVHTKVHSIRFKWHLLYTLVRNEYLKFLRKHTRLTASIDRSLILSKTTAAVVLSTYQHVKNDYSHSSILVYDHPMIRTTVQSTKRSGYRYNFDYEHTHDLRSIYQQLKSLTKNVAQLKNHTRNDDDRHADEQIYLSADRPRNKHVSQVMCHTKDNNNGNINMNDNHDDDDDDDFSSKCHKMPTMQRR